MRLLWYGGRYTATLFIFLERSACNFIWTNSMPSDDILLNSVMRQSKLFLRKLNTPPPDFLERVELEDISPRILSAYLRKTLFP